jgi:cobalamin biosynthetic protein CobC
MSGRSIERVRGVSLMQGRMTSVPTTPAPLAHGGRLGEAERLFPDAVKPWLDLSTGINPVAYPLPTFDAAWFTRLPEPETEYALREIAARAYGVADGSLVAAAPGTQILIDLLPRLWPAGRVLILDPTYGEYAHAWRRAGAAVANVGVLTELEAADVAIVCNPNNPDGRRVQPGDLVALADRLAARNGLLIVDEAFADLEEPISVAAALPHPALVALRSFGKTFGLAGLRLGFALAAEGRVQAIRAALGPWAVSGPALAIGCRALADRGWVAAAAARLNGETSELDRLIIAAGLRVVGGTRLFRLAEGEGAQDLFEQLGRAGIFVRRFHELPHRLRFGLPGSRQAWQRLRLAMDVPARSGRCHAPRDR